MNIEKAGVVNVPRIFIVVLNIRHLFVTKKKKKEKKTTTEIIGIYLIVVDYI
jgi:glucose uptake protein GlcU